MLTGAMLLDLKYLNWTNKIQITFLKKKKRRGCLNLTECQQGALKISTLNSTASTGIFSDIKCQLPYRNFDFK